MKQHNYYVTDLLDLDAPDAADDIVWRACRPTDAQMDMAKVVTLSFDDEYRGLSHSLLGSIVSL